MALRAPTLAFALLLAIPPASAQKPGGQPDPEDFPARTAQEGVTIAVVPVLDSPDAERIFGSTASPIRAGFLPVEFIIWNSRQNTIEVELDGVTIFSESGRFEPVDPGTVSLYLYPPPRREPEDPTQQKPRPRFPIPLPQKKKNPPKDKDLEKREAAEAELRSRELRSGRVPPGTYVRGYLYFDLGKASIDPAAAALFVPGAREIGTGRKLLFPEISLKPYE